MDNAIPETASTGDHSPLLFAVDYDGTFARAPKLFAQIIRMIFLSGNAAVMVTGRSDETPWASEVRAAISQLPTPIPVVFAGPGWKRDAAKKAGYKVDIWIDDFPEYVAPQDPELVAPKMGPVPVPPASPEAEDLAHDWPTTQEIGRPITGDDHAAQ